MPKENAPQEARLQAKNKSGVIRNTTGFVLLCNGFRESDMIIIMITSAQSSHSQKGF
jgi:hypothetical protein